MKITWWLTVPLLPVAAPVQAQGCSGMPAVNGVCIPPDHPSAPLNQAYGRALAERIALWKATWGPVSVDRDSGDISESTGRLSEREAGNCALHACARNGGLTCREPFTCRNQCVAIAWPSKAGQAFVTQAAQSMLKASALALARCITQGGTDSVVVYAACTEPLLIY